MIPSQVKNIAGLTIDWMRTLKTPRIRLHLCDYLFSSWDSGVDFISHNAPHLLLHIILLILLTTLPKQ
jgi:hypothetical protein